MKKFFKALALVLALTLVIGTVPASAATTYNIKSKRTLYVAPEGADPDKATARGTITAEDGTVTPSTAKARLTYAKLLGISKTEAAKHEISVTSTNKEIVKASNKTQRVRAYGIGTATLTIIVDGKKEGTVTVTSKKSSTDETVVFGTKDGYIKDGDELALGAEYKLSVPRLGQDTDYRAILVKDADGNDVTEKVAVEELDKNGKHTRLWTLKFTEKGSYSIQALAYQSEKYSDIISEGEVIDVTVVTAKPDHAKQTAATEVTVYFANDASAYKAEDFIIYYLNAANVKITDKVVKSISYNSSDNSIAVTTYTAFDKGVEYVVEVGGGEVGFTGKSHNRRRRIHSGRLYIKRAGHLVSRKIQRESERGVERI